jgi:predicted DNA-binding WGR domain protein
MKGQSTMATSVTPHTRRLEFSQGNSNKLWQAEVSGTTVTIRFRRIDRSGEVLVKSFTNETEAETHVGKLIVEKLEKGYRETT